jgi:hypothetical protein
VSTESALREKAREVLQAGTLPNRRPDRTWGGRGVGADCTICGVRVTPDELEFELEFARNGDRPALDKYHVHIRCFSIWDTERHNLEMARGATSTGDAERRPPVNGSQLDPWS